MNSSFAPDSDKPELGAEDVLVCRFSYRFPCRFFVPKVGNGAPFPLHRRPIRATLRSPGGLIKSDIDRVFRVSNAAARLEGRPAFPS